MPSSSGLAPAITATGITAGTYAQWLAYFLAQYQGIFGADVFVDNSDPDFQMMAVYALACSDCCSAAIAVYNGFSPATGQGAGLSSTVKINGLERLVPSFSTVPVTIVGIANTTITNGNATDSSNNVWALPANVMIPSSGTVTVIATCTVAGAITAAPNTITGIQTPVYGWQSVTNASAAAVGASVELDAALRIRQSQSVSLPSQTIFEGIVAALENLTGVTRVRGVENNTASVNGYGVPANALAFVVEGGTQSAIFAAIASKITPGIPTYGTISTTVTDSNGSTRLLSYSTPTDATISVVLTIAPGNGWSTATETIIQAAVVAYLEALAIGANISYTQLLIPAYLIGTQYFGTFNITGMTINKNSGSVVSADIQLNYNEAAVAAAANVTFVVT